MEKLVLVPYNEYQRLPDAQPVKMPFPTTPSTAPRKSDRTKPYPTTHKKLCLHLGNVLHQRKIESLLRSIRSRTGSPSERRKNPCHVPMSRMDLSSIFNRIHYLDGLRDAHRKDRLKMLKDITAGQLTCIGEVARRIYHQTYPFLTQDVTYFDDRSLVLRSLFSARVSFRRKKAVLTRYHRMILCLLRPHYLYATIQDQIRSQRES